MALDLSRERYGSKALPKGAEATGEEILARIAAAEPVRNANQLISDRNKFYSAVERDTTGANRFDAADYFEERKKQAEKLKERAAAMSLYMQDHADAFSGDSYERMRSILSTFDTEVDDVMSRYQPSLDAKLGMRAYEDELMAAMERNDQMRANQQSALFAFDPSQPTGFFDKLQQYTDDQSYRFVTDKWTDEERYELGMRQMEDPVKAAEFAANVNSYHNALATEPERQKIREQAAQNLWKNTGKALLASTFSAQDQFMDRMAEYAARGQTTEKDYVTPWDYAQETTGAISQKLNENAIGSDRYNEISGIMQEGIKENGVDPFYRNQDSMQTANDMFEGRGIGDLYNLGYSMAQNTLSRYSFGAIPGVGEAATLANYFASAATSGIDEARRMGADGDQAVASGIAKGTWEVATEVLGLDNLYKMGPAITWGDLFKQLGIQGLFEAFGEGANSALGYLSDYYILGDLSEYAQSVQSYMEQGETAETAKRKAFLDAAKNVGFEALSGAVSGWVSGGIETGYKTGLENQYYRNVNPQALIDLGMTAGEDTAAFKLAQQMQGQIAEGQKPTGNEKRVLAYNIELMNLAAQKVEAEMATANMTAEQTEGMKPTTSADGNARQISRNESINVDGFAEVKEGKATVKLKEGGTVDYQDVSFSTDKQANQYFAVESLPVIDTAHANDLLKTIQDADVGNDTSEVVAIRESYRLGYLGATTQELRGSDAQILSTKLQDQIYNIGKEQRTANDAVRAAASTAPTKATAGYKKVVIEGKLSRVTRDAAKKRKAEIEYVDRIADTFAGTAVHVYESYEKNGKRYYKDNSGKEQLAPHGKYVNDEIWLDLNSGDNGEGLMLNTFAHEMYHHIEKWNKPKARELAEFVVKELGLESVDKAVAAQIEKARAAGYGEKHFEGMSPEQARNEVYMRAMSDFVADSLETMFTRGDPAKAIANLKKENKGLFDQIKAFIDEWISKVKKFYSDKTISQEGAVVAQMEKFEQLQQLFMEAMAGAGENYRAALKEPQKGTRKEYVAQFSNRYADLITEQDREYLNSVNRGDMVAVQRIVDNEAKRWGAFLNNSEANEVFPQSGEVRTFYHGTNTGDFTVFDKGLLGNSSGDLGWFGKGFYFAFSADEARTYGSRVIQAYLKMKNPYDYSQLYKFKGSDRGSSKYARFAWLYNIVKQFPDIVTDQKVYAYPNDSEEGKVVSWKQLVRWMDRIEKDAKFSVDQVEQSNGDTAWELRANPKQESFTNADGETFTWTEYGMRQLFATEMDAKEPINQIGAYLVNVMGVESIPRRSIEKIDFSGAVQRAGYDGIIQSPNGDEAVVFDPSQIKSADPVTYDDDGNIIPISQRFNEENEDIRYSLRNQQPTTREILTQIDTSTRNKHEANLLGKYQENLSTLAELEPRLEELNDQIAELSQDKTMVKERLAVQKEQRQVKASVNRLKGLVNAFERSDMGKRLVTEVREKTRQEQDRERLKSYKAEQKELIQTMQAEQRVIREELTGTRSVMSIMEDEFVRLAKDLEAKKIDLKTMEEKFLLVSKQYDKDTQKWLREYRNLMSKYRKLDARNDRNLSKIEQLEKIILQQRQTARAKVTSRRNTELRHKIQRKANELNQLLIHGTKHRNVPEYLQPAVADILNAINMEVRDGDQRRATYEATMARYDRRIAMTNDPSEVSRLIEKRNEYAAKGDQFANKMAKLKEAYQKIQDDKIPNMEIDEGLASRLMELFVVVGDTPLGQMTSEQLEAVNDVLNITKATVRNANEILAEERSVGVSEDSKATTMEVRRYGETKKQKTRMRKMFEQFGWNNLKPEHFFDVIGSKTLKARYETLRKGEDTLAVDLNEAKEFFREQWKKNGGKEWDMEQKWQFTSTSGKSFELDLNQIMSLYALAKDNDARSHLRVGGFAFDSDYQTQKRGPLNIPIKVESTDASAYNLSDEILGEIISKLTPQQRAFADAMQAYLSDTMAAKGNEVSLKKYGIRLFKKKDYFPIRVADQFLAKAREQNAGDRKIKDSGFTKDRKPEAKNPVVLSGFTEVWAEHVDEMILYHSFVLPLDDFNRVLNYHDAFVEGEQAASVVEAITNAFGKGAVNYIDQLIKDVNGGIKGGSTVSFANSLVSKAKKAQTMASLSVAIQQPSSIIRAMSEVDIKYFLGPRVTEKSHDRTWDEIKEHAPIAIIKEMGGYDTNVGKSTVDYLIDTADYDGFGEKFKAMFTDEKFRDDALGRLPALMDEMSWGVIWNAVKREQRDLHPNMDTKSDAFMKLVANRFTEVITRTQVYDSVFSRSGLMRDRKSDLAKMITSFMAEPTTTANMLAVSILQAKRGDIPKKQAVKATASIVASLALNAALVSVVYAMRDDDEDKRYDEKWIENFRNNFFESLNPLGYIPYVRDIYNLFAKGYDVERADMELFGDLQNAIEGLDNEDITAWEKTENVIGAIGNLLGVPVKNILRDVKGFVQTLGFAWDDRPNPKTKTGTYMAWRGMDLNDKEQMILAIQSGDEEHLQRVFGRFENQQKAESALQSAIREKYVAGEMTAEEAEEMLTTNFDRDDEYEVYWILEEWDYAKENGSTDGYTKYGSLYEAIENGEYETEIARFLDHGADTSTIRSQISKHYRKQYLEDETAREEIREKLLPVYEATGMYASEIEDKFNDWDFEAEYGMTYSNFKAEYREGNVTEAELRSAMDFYGLLNYEIEEGIRELNKEIKFFNKYGMSISEMRDAYDNGDLSKNELINALMFTGKTRTEATEEVNERDIERKYGIGYAKLDDAYKYNDISRSAFYNAMREHGATQQEADEAILGYDWLKKNVKKYPDLAISDAKRFVIKVSDKMEERTLTDYGVSIDAYLQYKEGAKDCPGVDADGDGQIDAYSKAKQLFAMIDKLPISDEAKDGLALITNAKSTLRKYAPWH